MASLIDSFPYYDRFETDCRGRVEHTGAEQQTAFSQMEASRWKLLPLTWRFVVFPGDSQGHRSLSVWLLSLALYRNLKKGKASEIPAIKWNRQQGWGLRVDYGFCSKAAQTLASVFESLADASVSTKATLITCSSYRGMLAMSAGSVVFSTLSTL